MDISKLPRMSKTTTPPNEAGPDVPAPPGAGFPVAPPDAATPDTSSSPPAASPAVWCKRCHAPNAAGAQFCNSCGAPLSTRYSPVAGGGVEAWLSIGLGAILLLMNPRLLQYLSHVWFGTFFSPYLMPDGTEVPYTDQLDFWSDLGITLFALVLVLDGVILVISRRAWLIGLTLALTVAATLYNLGYLVFTFNRGLALMSAFAVLFGGYISVHQWQLLQRLRLR